MTEQDPEIVGGYEPEVQPETIPFITYVPMHGRFPKEFSDCEHFWQSWRQTNTRLSANCMSCGTRCYVAIDRVLEDYESELEDIEDIPQVQSLRKYHAVSEWNFGVLVILLTFALALLVITS